MSNPRYEVAIHRTDQWQQTYFLAGLYELAHRNEVQLVFRPHFVVRSHAVAALVDRDYRKWWAAGRPLAGIGEYTITDHETKRRLRVGMDYGDSRDLFDEPMMTRADIVFKRHYAPPFVDRLPAPLKAKIHPAGLIFGIRSAYETRTTLLNVAGLLNIITSINYRRFRAKDWFLWNVRAPIKEYVGALIDDFPYLPHLADFEQRDDPLQSEPLILFQPRTWEVMTKSQTDKAVINEQRANMIRLLRKTFGERFVGGFVPDDYAREHYPDCLTEQPTGKEAYFRLVRRAAIVISTQGLQFSQPWKLAEYLAAGKAIVSNPLTTILPQPLRQDHEIAYYDSDESCVAQITRLLEDRQHLQTLQQGALAYYRDQVEPTVAVRRMITQAFELTS